MNISRLAENLLIVFLGLSCVFWLPGIPVSALETIKTFCLLSGGGFVVLVAAQHTGLRIPNGVAGLGGFFLIFLASSGAFFQAESNSEIFRWFYNYGIAFITMSVMFMYACAGGDVARIVRGAAKLLSIIVIVAFLAAATDFQGIVAPEQYGSRTVRENGFAASRAGWSVGLGVFLPALFVVWYEQFRDTRRAGALLMLWLTITSTLGSQLLCGGRTGLLASLVSLMLLVWNFGGKRRLLFLLAGIFTYVYVNMNFLVSQLRLDSGDGDLSDLSTGRTDGFQLAWDAFWQRPFTGNGFGVIKGAEATGTSLDIHNLWLASLADGGIFLTLAMSAFLLALLWQTWPLMTHHVRLWRAAPVVFLAALTACLLEPAILFGAFQATALFWFMAGFARAYLFSGPNEFVSKIVGDRGNDQVGSGNLTCRGR